MAADRRARERIERQNTQAQCEPPQQSQQTNIICGAYASYCTATTNVTPEQPIYTSPLPQPSASNVYEADYNIIRGWRNTNTVPHTAPYISSQRPNFQRGHGRRRGSRQHPAWQGNNRPAAPMQSGPRMPAKRCTNGTNTTPTSSKETPCSNHRERNADLGVNQEQQLKSSMHHSATLNDSLNELSYNNNNSMQVSQLLGDTANVSVN